MHLNPRKSEQQPVEHVEHASFSLNIWQNGLFLAPIRLQNKLRSKLLLGWATGGQISPTGSTNTCTVTMPIADKPRRAQEKQPSEQTRGSKDSVN